MGRIWPSAPAGPRSAAPRGVRAALQPFHRFPARPRDAAAVRKKPRAGRPHLRHERAIPRDPGGEPRVLPPRCRRRRDSRRGPQARPAGPHRRAAYAAVRALRPRGPARGRTHRGRWRPRRARSRQRALHPAPRLRPQLLEGRTGFCEQAAGRARGDFCEQAAGRVRGTLRTSRDAPAPPFENEEGASETPMVPKAPSFFGDARIPPAGPVAGDQPPRYALRTSSSWSSSSPVPDRVTRPVSMT